MLDKLKAVVPVLQGLRANRDGLLLREVSRSRDGGGEAENTEKEDPRENIRRANGHI